jgi:hypothetical protein
MLGCENFECSANVRRLPSMAYSDFEVEAAGRDRIAALQLHAGSFADVVIKGSDRAERRSSKPHHRHADARHPFTTDPDGFLRDIEFLRDIIEAYLARGISLVELANVGHDPVAFVRELRPLVPRLAVLCSSGCA